LTAIEKCLLMTQSGHHARYGLSCGWGVQIACALGTDL